LVQIVDSEENVQRLLPVVEDMMNNGLIAMSDVKILRIQRPSLDQ
jgi:PII-like signaling protein